MKTVVMALAAAMPYILPGVVDTMKEAVFSQMMNPTWGFDTTLTNSCGMINADYNVGYSASLEQCLQNYYQADPSPQRAG